MNTPTRNISSVYSLAEVRVTFMRAVYLWMTGGILITAIVASYLGANPDLLISLVHTPIIFYGLVIVQLGAVITLSAAINRMQASTAAMIYLAYAALTGVTLSTIFLVYAHDSIASVFFTTAFSFAGLSLIGFTTKRDLGPVGTFCGMALFGMIGWALLSFFIPSMMGGNAHFAYSVIGVLVFSGLTAYDTQKIKNLANSMQTGVDASERDRKAAIFGALTLYLDFINLFLMLLRLLGDRRR